MNPEFFAHYWTERQFKREAKSGGMLDHTASNLPEMSRLNAGDYLYVWSLVDSQLMVVGRMKADAPIDAATAQVRLKSDTLYPAQHHVLAIPGTATPCYFDLPVPQELVSELLLLRADGPKPPLLTATGQIHQQTLRRMVRLSPATAQMLDGLLKSKGARAPETQKTAASSTQKNEAALKKLERLQKEGAAVDGYFDPANVEDDRQRRLASIVMRRGQGKFRRSLLQAYNRQCAISGCAAVEVLEAAHILRYKGLASNHVTNGLLLRADLHTLFDLHLVTIDSATMTIRLHPSLHKTEYKNLNGQPLRLPTDKTQCPNKLALDQHRSDVG